ncbi:MAG: OsmC family protein [Tepidisphaeraceae bacterium]
MKRSASAVWNGSLKEGKGTLSGPSGVLKNTPYTFRSRFESDPQTNPEELIAAAHAGCFAMALSNVLGQAGVTPERLAATANLTMEPVDGKPTITAIHLDLVAKIPGIDQAKFDKAANDAKAGCVVSRALNAKITMDAKLES